MVLLNEREIWAAVRFSRLLAVPLAWYLGGLALKQLRTVRLIKFGVAGTALILLASQFAFSYYMARIWVFTPI